MCPMVTRETHHDGTVLCIGASTIDTIMRVPSLASTGTKVLATDMVQCAAGMATSAAVAISRVGGNAAMCAVVGNDLAGQAYIADLKAEKVDLTHVRIDPSARTAVSTVLVEEGTGERLVVPFYPPEQPSDGQDPTKDSGCVPLLCCPTKISALLATKANAKWRLGFDLVLADPRRPLLAARELDAARAKGITTMLDADITPSIEILLSLAQRCDYVVFSTGGLASVVPQALVDMFSDEPQLSCIAESLRAVAGKVPGAVSVTLGRRGFAWLDKEGEVFHIPAPTVNVVDTLAAGDVFHGVFALGIARGNSIGDAARVACAAAALKCRTFGGRLGTPRKKELDDFLKDWHPVAQKIG